MNCDKCNDTGLINGFLCPFCKTNKKEIPFKGKRNPETNRILLLENEIKSLKEEIKQLKDLLEKK